MAKDLIIIFFSDIGAPIINLGGAYLNFLNIQFVYSFEKNFSAFSVIYGSDQEAPFSELSFINITLLNKKTQANNYPVFVNGINNLISFANFTFINEEQEPSFYNLTIIQVFICEFNLSRAIFK